MIRVMIWLAAALGAAPGDEAARILKAAGLGTSGLRCRVAARCGDLVAIDCQAEVDGPYYYINVKKKKLVQCCGGCCLVPEPERKGTTCTECPPKAWKCVSAAEEP